MRSRPCRAPVPGPLVALPVAWDANMDSDGDADEVGLRKVLLQWASHVAELDGGDQNGPVELAQAISELARRFQHS